MSEALLLSVSRTSTTCWFATVTFQTRPTMLVNVGSVWGRVEKIFSVLRTQWQTSLTYLVIYVIILVMAPSRMTTTSRLWRSSISQNKSSPLLITLAMILKICLLTIVSVSVTTKLNISFEWHRCGCTTFRAYTSRWWSSRHSLTATGSDLFSSQHRGLSMYYSASTRSLQSWCSVRWQAW